MRRVSRRPEGGNVIRDAAVMQRTMNRLRGGALVPRGVYRFARHEDAEEWMVRMIASTHAATATTDDRQTRVVPPAKA